MVSRSLEKLEYNAIMALLSSRAATSIGRALCTGLRPASSLSESCAWLCETDEAVRRLLKWGDLPFSGIDDIRPAVKRASGGCSHVRGIPANRFFSASGRQDARGGR